MNFKQLLTWTSRSLGIQIQRYHAKFHPGVVSLPPKSRPRGTVLIAYILDPFVRKKNEAVSVAHTHHWESVLMAEAWRDHGFAVDVLDYRNDEFQPAKHYDYFVSARTHLATLAPRLSRDCVKIAHLDTAPTRVPNAVGRSRTNSHVLPWEQAQGTPQRHRVTSTQPTSAGRDPATEA